MRKTIFLLSLALLFAVSACKQSGDKPSNEKILSAHAVPANKAYAEPYTSQESGVSIPVGWPETKGVVSEWTDAGRSVVWYLYQTKGRYDLFFDVQTVQDANLKFDLKVSSCDSIGFRNFSRVVDMRGTGEYDTVFGAYLNIPQTGYYRYELKPLADPNNSITIRSLVFKAFEPDSDVHHTDYQSSPSVHLSFSSTEPTTKAYDWIYEEILVPEGSDPLATYYMSLGFYRGYMGIQTNSETERRVLFSVWDSKDADHDQTMQAADFVSLVDKDEATTVNSFGNEGTGGQSYVKTADWKTGKPVQFLMNVRPMKDNSVLLSAWYCVSPETGWKYVATWRAPHENKLFDGFYSFIENYGYTNGQLPRKAYYYNAWGKENEGGKWVNFNKVRFSNTDGREGQRVDYEQGVAPEFPDRFYMASGGYTPTVKTANEMPVSTVIPDVDTDAFAKRVDEALKNESKHKDAVKKEVRIKKQNR